MDSCRLCGQHNLLLVLTFGQQPIAHHLLADPSEEEYVHPLTVCFCKSCGLVQLINPIPPEMFYTEYFCLSSWKWQPHIPRLRQLIGKLPGLAKTDTIVEIGSNDGIFLEILMQQGYQNVFGIEPAQDALKAAQGKGVQTLGAYLNTQVAEDFVSKSGQCDLLVARQVLEHITDLETFRKAIRILLRPGGYVLIEVPNFGFSLSTADYSGIWEEHVNYFTLGSLKRFLAETGIHVIHNETANFSGQALIVLGKLVDNSLSQPPDDYLPELQRKVFAYRDHWPNFRNSFIQYLTEYRNTGRKVAVYGAGCRSCSLTNFVGLGPYIGYVVDDQLEKQTKYMPGSRLPILPRETLDKDFVDLCLLAVNAENDEKVIARHQAYKQKGGRFIPILPPSDHMLPFWSYTYNAHKAI